MLGVTEDVAIDHSSQVLCVCVFLDLGVPI